MEAIINGLRYDTDKSVLITSDRYWDGNNWDRSGRSTYLYRTKNGRFFLHHDTRWQGEQDTILPLTDDLAKIHYERLTEYEMTYKEAFGVDVPDA